VPRIPYIKLPGHTTSYCQAATQAVISRAVCHLKKHSLCANQLSSAAQRAPTHPPTCSSSSFASCTRLSAASSCPHLARLVKMARR
jgi:hypothetical protein